MFYLVQLVYDIIVLYGQISVVFFFFFKWIKATGNKSQTSNGLRLTF